MPPAPAVGEDAELWARLAGALSLRATLQAEKRTEVERLQLIRHIGTSPVSGLRRAARAHRGLEPVSQVCLSILVAIITIVQ
ncbi:MAG: hypothetical protein L6Q69_20390 [Zoogloea sp.]|nr:hypothetical protein [Zoogloea sp.]